MRTFTKAIATVVFACAASLFLGNHAVAQSASEEGSVNKPVFVMVHGTFQWAGQYEPLSVMLRNEGFEVVELPLTGLGEKEHLLSKETGLSTHVHDVANALSWRDLENVILVGHSYGGTVITGAAAHQPDRIKHLVYLDTVPADDGESLMTSFFDAATRDEVYAMVEKDGDGWLIPKDGLREALPTMRPHPFKTYTDRLALPDGTPNFPGTILVANDSNPFFQYMRTVEAPARVEKRGWDLITVEGPHQLMEVSPAKETVADILLGIARN